MSEGGEGVTDLFHSCKRCACNANSLHPSRFAKTEAVWGEGSLRLSSDVATVILPHHIQAEEILFEMRLVWEARTHRARWGTPQENQKREPALQTQVCFLF